MKKATIGICLLMGSLAAMAEKAYLDNGRVRLGVDLERGGTICFLSTGSDLEKDNMVNIHDLGRYIQQSYYAGEAVDRRSEGQHPTFSPWHWNPIQAGGIGCVAKPPHANARAEILEHKQTSDTMYIKCIPRLWDMPGEAAECVFEQWMWLDGDAVRVSNKVTIARTDTIWEEGVVRDQELPAVYPIARLRDCYTYTGDAPWSMDAAVKMPDNPKGYRVGLPPTDPNGFPWNRFKPTEPWAASVNPKTGTGFGIYSPRADATWLSGFVNDLKRQNGRDDSMANSTSYISPLTQIALNKDSVFGYTYYLIPGSVKDVRRFVYAKEKKPWPKPAPTVGGASRSPNVVLIMADDLGFGDLSCYNSDSAIHTPNIDRIAEQGVKFTSFHVNSVCVPSRVSLMSGQYTLDCEEKPHAAATGIKQNVTLLPQLLKDAGYATGGFGKWHLGNGEGDHPSDRGFDEWFGFYGGWIRYKYEQAKETHVRHIKTEPHMQILYDGKEKSEEPWEHMTDLLTDKAMGFVNENKDKPFFVFLSYNAPHGWLYHETHPEYSATDEWVELVKTKYNLPDETPMQRNLIDYIAVTEHMDARIGDLLALLKKQNLDQDTLVLFMSDNGAITPEFYYTLSASGNNGELRAGKATPYEGGVRVPMMMRCPAAIAANKTVSGFTMSVDILPTLLDFADVPVPETNGDHPLRGISLMPYLKQPQKSLPERTAFFVNGGASGVGIIKEPWKLVTHKQRVGLNADLKTNEGPTDGWLLFNLEDDLGERKDLSKQYPEKTEELLSFWKDYNQSIGREVK